MIWYFPCIMFDLCKSAEEGSTSWADVTKMDLDSPSIPQLDATRCVRPHLSQSTLSCKGSTSDQMHGFLCYTKLSTKSKSTWMASSNSSAIPAVIVLQVIGAREDDDPTVRMWAGADNHIINIYQWIMCFKKGDYVEN